MKRGMGEWEIRRNSAWVILAFILLASGALTVTAMRRTSTTFDEIVMIAAGARGYETGRWNIVLEHPPFTQYMYGILPYLSGAKYPVETGISEEIQRKMGYRYQYAQAFFWTHGNDAEKLAFLGRLPAVLCALLLIASVFAFMRTYFGDGAAVIAATITAFLPDVLAHGGVAYNDIPVALTFFLGAWLLDEAIRRPTVAKAIGAGIMCALALGIKNSAIGLGLLAFVLLAVEATQRWKDLKWWRNVLAAGALTLFVMYLSIVVIYRGDFALTEYKYALSWVFRQVSTTNAPAYLLGTTSNHGIWYYFPVAFLFKTSVALHVMLLIAVAYYIAALKNSTLPTPQSQSGASRLRMVINSPLRAPFLAFAVFAFMLARSQLHIGFRYALPMLPLLAVMIAPAIARVWSSNWHRLRPVVGVALAWMIIHPITYYPNFLAYVSEYGPGRSRNYEVLADSSIDWGQGLLQLRDYLREKGIDRIYLSYFGSALPSGYGIEYVALPSFFALPQFAQAQPEPRYIAISATNLTGAYFGEADPFRQFRNQEPEAVIAQTIYLYRIHD